MTEPKYEIGTRVMIRSDTDSIDDCYVVQRTLTLEGVHYKDFNGRKGPLHKSGWYYVVTDDDVYMHRECCVFPYQQPGDDFKTVMDQLTNPSTIANPVTGPIQEPA